MTAQIITGSQNGRSFELRASDELMLEGPVWSLFLTKSGRGLVYAAHDRHKQELHGIAIEFLWTGNHP